MMDSYIKKITEKVNNCPKIQKWLEMNRLRGNKFIWPNSEEDINVQYDVEYISKYYYVCKKYNGEYEYFIKPGFIINTENDNIFYRVYNVVDDMETEITNTIKEYKDDKLRISFPWDTLGKNKFRLVLEDYNIKYEYECCIFNIDIINNYYTIVYTNPHNIVCDNLKIKLYLYDQPYDQLFNNIEYPEVQLIDYDLYHIANLELINKIVDTDNDLILYTLNVHMLDNNAKPKDNTLHIKFRLRYIDSKNNEFFYISDLIKTNIYFFSSFNVDYNNIYLGNNEVSAVENKFYISNVCMYFDHMSIDYFQLYRITIDNFKNCNYNEAEYVNRYVYNEEYLNFTMYNMDPNYIYLFRIEYYIYAELNISGFLKKPIIRPQYESPIDIGDVYMKTNTRFEIVYKIIDDKLKDYYKNISNNIRKMVLSSNTVSYDYNSYNIDDNNYIHFIYYITISQLQEIPLNNDLFFYYEFNNNNNVEKISADVRFIPPNDTVGCFYISKNVMNTDPLVKSSNYYYEYRYITKGYEDIIRPFLKDVVSGVKEYCGFRNIMKSYYQDNVNIILNEYKTLIRDNYDNIGYAQLGSDMIGESSDSGGPILCLMNVDLIGRTVISVREDMSFYLVFYYFNSTVVENAYIQSIDNIYLKCLCKDENTGEDVYVTIGSLYSSLTKRRGGSLISDLVKLDYVASAHNPTGLYPYIDFEKYDFRLFGDINLYINNTIAIYKNVLFHNNVFKLDTKYD